MLGEKPDRCHLWIFIVKKYSFISMVDIALNLLNSPCDDQSTLAEENACRVVQSSPINGFVVKIDICKGLSAEYEVIS